ncbi:MAG: alpha/beta hydrolase, partial [Acidimicrobiia bacterium]|nr:alpha/beta hydrolase [Acidimicrobiia bacterium]
MIMPRACSSVLTQETGCSSLCAAVQSTTSEAQTMNMKGTEGAMRCRVLPLLPAAAVILCTSIASAQDWRTYYTVQHAAEFKINWAGFYEKATAFTASTRQTLPHVLDIKYGDHAKQALDLYLPRGARPAGAPVFVFIHGGGFREGDRAQYGYIAAPFAAQGIITAVVSYRLTPGATHPAQPEDIQQAIAWVWKNIRSHGGDPARLYVGGHSAGAILTADVGLRSDWRARHGLPADAIKGLVPVSGGYDLTSLPSVNNYVPDAARRAEASPINHVTASAPRTLVVLGSVEPYLASSQALVDRINGKSGQAVLLVLPDLDHAQTVLT